MYEGYKVAMYPISDRYGAVRRDEENGRKNKV